jgi:4-amino-4-deoxy-L-arabinose transferase-like glycosyltransferase
MWKQLKSPWVIFLIALILRSLLLIVAVQYPQRTISNDTHSYVQPAESLLASHGYSFPGVLRTPLYPMFLALIFAFFGENLPIIVLAQVIVSALTVVLTYQAGILLLPRRVALIGAFLLALSLESIIAPFFILTDTLFAFLFLGATYAFLRYWSVKRISWLISSAILMGLSILCRPIAIYFPVVIVILLAMVHWKHWVGLFSKSLVYLVVVSAVMAAWFARSQVVDGAPILSTISNYNLLFYNDASLDTSLHGGNVNQYRDSYSLLVKQALDEKGLPRTEANLDREYKTLAVKKILANPVQFAIVQVRDDLQNLLPGWANTLQILAPTGQVGIQGTDVLRHAGLAGVFQTYFGGRLWLLILILPFIVLLGIVYLSDFAGMIFLVRTKGWFTLAALILPIAYLLLIPGAPSNSRFRIPAMPMICLLAGIGIDWIWSQLDRNKKARRSTT